MSYYRCENYIKKCNAKIRIDEKLKYAELLVGGHNHKAEIDKPKAKPISKSMSENGLQNFNKDVTNEVELITNDRDVMLLFHKGCKFTRYFENKTHIRC